MRGVERLDIGVFKNELSLFEDFVFPFVECGNLLFWEDDVDDFQLHETKHQPDVPTFCNVVAVAPVDFSADGLSAL